MAKIEKIGNIQIVDNKEDKFFYFPMISMACTGRRNRTGRERSPRRRGCRGVGCGCGTGAECRVWVPGAGESRRQSLPGLFLRMFSGGSRCRDRFCGCFRAVAAAAVRAERFVRSRFPVSGSCACVPDFADFQAGRRIFSGKSLFLPPELPCTVRPSGNDDHFITLSR